MSVMILLGIAAAAGAVFVGRRAMLPRCPRCHSKEWDRRLCAPLLFCRRCATRIDHEGQLYN